MSQVQLLLQRSRKYKINLRYWMVILVMDRKTFQKTVKGKVLCAYFVKHCAMKPKLNVLKMMCMPVY
jgi:hypothetical protein